MKAVLELNLCLTAQPPHTRYSTYGAAGSAHDRRRERRKFVLATNTFEQRFEFNGLL